MPYSSASPSHQHVKAPCSCEGAQYQEEQKSLIQVVSFWTASQYQQVVW